MAVVTNIQHLSTMTAEEFTGLPLTTQSQYISEKGKFLLCRKGFRYTCNLFAIEHFFAEVWYNMENDSIVDIIPFDDPQRLDAFLDDLSLEGLL